MRAADRLNGWLRRVPVWPLYPLALLPAAHDFWLAFGNRLGADPVKELEHRLGLAGAAAPDRGAQRDAAARGDRGEPAALPADARAHGLLLRGCCTSRSGWCSTGSSPGRRCSKDLVKRPYIVLGFTALLLLVPLAATSWNGAVRRMGGAAWRRLHRLAYPATLLRRRAFRLAGQGLAAGAARSTSRPCVLLLGWRLVPRRRRGAARPAPA